MWPSPPLSEFIGANRVMRLSFTSRRLVSLLSIVALALTFAVTSAGTKAFAALKGTVSLTIHYQRPGNDYEGYNAYLWRDDNGGKDKEVSPTGFSFAGDTGGTYENGTDDFGAYVTVLVDGMDGYKDMGFIIRSKPDWSGTKDVSADRFISFDDSNNAEIWTVQGDPTVYTSSPDIAPQISSATIDDFRLITVSLNASIDLVGTENEGFSIDGGESIVGIRPLNGSAADGTGTQTSKLELTLGSDIGFGTTYHVSLAAHGTHPDFGTATATIGALMNSDGFNAAFTYTGDDLGNTWSADSTKFRVWAPTAEGVQVLVLDNLNQDYDSGHLYDMTKSDNGTWLANVSGDLNGKAYMYKVHVNGMYNLAVDPYARAVTVNGDRGVVENMAATDPTGFSTESKPAFSGKATDASIYELHVRDLSMDANSGIPAAHKGKFLALTDLGTSTTFKVTTKKTKTKKATTTTYKTLTGLSAIKDLGVTHVQLQPIFDFASGGVETAPTFNWGYDPLNYNAPEGQYSTDPTNPVSRITELKQAVQAMHANGLRVDMDVVYNHVSNADSFSENQIVPGYFFRTDATGAYTNASGCGNDVASERPMVRKFIVDSVKYWASQYHLDGFRFDLMGLMDITTINAIRSALNQIDPTILVIGEGWNMGTLPEDQRATQANIQQMPGVGAFNDEFRDGVKGSVFDDKSMGYVNGNPMAWPDLRASITGQTQSADPLGTYKWTTLNAGQSVNYVEAHDNLTLWDKLVVSAGGSHQALAQMDQQAAALVFLSEGLPFMQAGQEFLRSKDGDANSYQSSDAVNAIRWKERALQAQTLNFYKGVIAIRKAHPAFRMDDAATIGANMKILSTRQSVVAWKLTAGSTGDKWKTTIVAFNPKPAAYKLSVPKGNWQLVVSGTTAGLKTLKTFKGATSVSIPGMSAIVIHQ